MGEGQRGKFYGLKSPLINLAHLVWIHECPSVDAVVRSVELSLWEPSHVSGLKAAMSNRLERNVPVDCLASQLQDRFEQHNEAGALAR